MEDIGFLKRVNTTERSLDFRGETLTFWSDYISVPREDLGLLDREWRNNELSRNYILSKIIQMTINDERNELSLRKEIRIDRPQLTARGFELASIIYPDFNQIIECNDIANCESLGFYAKKEFRDRILLEWVEIWASMGVEVVHNYNSLENKDGMKIIPDRLYDLTSEQWLPIDLSLSTASRK